MMRYALLLILSFLSISPAGANQLAKSNTDSTFKPETIYSAEPKPEANIPLDYKIMETNVKGFVTSLKDRYPVQLGAFRLKYNAEAFLKEVRTHIDKNAIMFEEEGLFKVRISRTPESQETEISGIAETTTREISSPVADSEKADTTETASDIPDSTGAVAIIPQKTNNVTEATLNEPDDGLIIGGNSPWLKRIAYFGKSLALINALVITILICIVSMILLLIVILLNRRRMEKKEKLHQYLLEKYQELIINYLFGNASPEDFRPIASDTYRRHVLIDEMIDVSINLKGEEAKKLLGLYKHLGLNRDSTAKAYDRRWHKKIKGFRELAFMNIKDANDVIYKALNSSNEILRMEAQIALVRLGDDNPFEFLSQLKRPFSLWEQISLHELIVQHNIPVPSFKTWLTSGNPTVVMFALRMIREFKQNDAEEGVHDMLMHPDPSIRQLAVQVAGDLNMRSTLETMKHMYKFQEYNIGLEIVRSMGKMPDLSMMGFLNLVLDKEDDVQLQIEAVKAIENNGEEGVKALVKIMKSEYKNYNIIVRHVLDRRIF